MTEPNSSPAAEPEGPSWFVEACAQSPTSDALEVDGRRISYLVWDPPAPATAAPLLLLHGTAAHSWWWSHLAPLLGDDRRVVAMDFSGHGDSDHRSGYDIDGWADEVLAVARAIDPASDGLCVVGHSLGGNVATVAAARNELPLLGLAQLETVRDTSEAHHPPDMRPARKRYATAEDACARFRPIPSQPGNLPFVVEWIARRSVRRFEDGWGWKHDPDLVLGLKATVPRIDDLVPLVGCPIAVVHGQHGFVTRDDARRIAAAAGKPTPTIELPTAGHHPMFDQPLALVTALRLLLATWG
jgi:pimeloyl-ACP methyl ester carboxylesterase